MTMRGLFVRGTLKRPGLRHRRGFSLLEVMIVVLIIGILAAIAVPNFIKARETTRQRSCIANLSQIQAAKQQWAMDNSQAGSGSPGWDDLVGATAYIRATPVCPAGTGTYTINTVDMVPTCPNVGTNPTHTIP